MQRRLLAGDEASEDLHRIRLHVWHSAVLLEEVFQPQSEMKCRSETMGSEDKNCKVSLTFQANSFSFFHKTEQKAFLVTNDADNVVVYRDLNPFVLGLALAAQALTNFPGIEADA